jgi:hypothetical protein
MAASTRMITMNHGERRIITTLPSRVSRLVAITG